MSREFYDVEKQVHRESEGQDTITPLNNAFFVRQIGRLKNLSASNKSLSSIHSSSSLSNGAANPVEFEFETKSMMSDAVHFGKAKNRLDIPRSFLSIFRSDKASKTNISELFNESVRLSPTFESKRQPDADDLNLNTTFYSNITSHTIKQSAQNLNQTDKVFDALSNIIIANTASNHQVNAVAPNNYFQNGKIHLDNEFIENVKLIVRENEANKKRKINKSRFLIKMCRFLLPELTSARDTPKRYRKIVRVYELDTDFQLKPLNAAFGMNLTI
ncbi:hypothetical protein BpHYR1_038549 [Brachionus plicatilis]|uniref:Uncharacterized protein n=1 Tax=Brachionus plicatilis TaxID=10195 RepID=A0A3M7R2Z6_BRAPC|nr:hypothetical protein BpHYR1_038549 [Brachionus plicatilis]